MIINVEPWVYKPHIHDDPPLNPERCTFRVTSRYSSAGLYQCHRRVKTHIGGYGFCTQHANVLTHLVLNAVDQREKREASPATPLLTNDDLWNAIEALVDAYHEVDASETPIPDSLFDALEHLESAWGDVLFSTTAWFINTGRL